jgi:hypothetical protein
MKHLYEALIFVDSVVNENRAMNQFPNPRPFADDAAHTREASQQINVVEQGVAKAGGRLDIVFGDVADDAGKIS